MDIQRDNFFPGRLYQDSFLHGKPRDRPREYPKLENKQRLNLPAMPHSRFNKIPDRTHYRNDMQFGDGSTWSTFPVMKLSPMGWVCDYDGVAMYGNCGNHASLDITDAISIKVRVKTPVIALQDIISKSINLTEGYVLYFRDTLPYLRWRIEKVVDINCDVDTQYQDGILHYIASSFNGFVLKCYVDGIEKGTEDYTGSIESTLAGALRIGNSVIYNQYFNGTIDITIKALAESAAKQKDDYWRQA